MIIKLILGLLALLLIYLQYSLWLGPHGIVKLRQLEQSVVLQKQDNAELGERNQKLHAEVIDLKQGSDALEERARSELGMIKPGEIFYQVIDQQLPPAPIAR